MLPRLMIAPAPRLAISGAIAATRKSAERTLAANIASNVAGGKVGGRAEPGEAHRR